LYQKYSRGYPRVATRPKILDMYFSKFLYVVELGWLAKN